MRKTTTLIILLLCAVTLFAQAPEKFSYQAVVRNANNSLVSNAQVGVRVNILQGGVSGTLVYMETHSAVTNANGLITLQIGGGTVQQGVFAGIDWADGPYFLKTETDPNGGSDYSVTSTQQLLSVPYALYSKEAGNGFSGDYNDLTNTPVIPTVPTDVSVFNNDVGYITMEQVPAQVNADWNATTGAAEILNKPAIPTIPANVSAFNNDAGYITMEQVPAQVNADWNATTGAALILNKPTLFSGNYNDLTNKPILFDGNYNSLSNRPNLAAVAISGSYNDLINKPAIPTTVGELTNNVGFITLSQVPAQVNADWNATTGAAQILNKPTLFSGNYNDLTNKPTIPTVPTNVSAFTNDAGYITSADVQAAAGIPTNVSAFTNDANYITLAQVPAQVNADWNATSGAAKILNKPTIPTVPTNVSSFTNDSHYITEAQLNTLMAAMNNTIDSLRDRIEELENNPPAPQEGLPTVITLQATNVTGTSAQCGGNIPSDGGSAITARGICWSVSSNPTIDGDHTMNGTGAGTFYANLYDLQSGTTYHVRAYATNSIGTEYGNEVTFTTATPTVDGEPCPGMPTVTDVDGNIYNTVAIGQQCWMKENLKTTQFSDGTSIPWSSSNSTVPARYNPGGNASNVSTYGYLYNWYAVMNGNASSNSNPSPVQGVCPSGWHVPSNMEWSQLTGYVSAFTDFQCDNNAQNIAKALAATTNWSAIGSILCAVGYNTNLNNATGFSALPGGTRTGSVGTDGYFWTCTQSDVSTAYAIHLAYNSPSLTVGADNAKTAGYSVRCVSDIAIGGGVTQVVVTGGVTSITENSAVCGGSVIMDNGSSVTARGVCWSTSPHPTVDGPHTVETAALGGFTSNLTGLEGGTTYYVRAYAVIGGEIYYGNEIFFTTLTPFICGTSTVTDYDGNVYNTVQIGDQCWMKENMRVSHKADGGALGTYHIGSTSVEHYWTHGYNPGNTSSYGYLYTWSVARYVCPTGWHLPSDGEWTELTQYVSNQSQYLCSNNTSYIAKALASTNGWNSSTGTCEVGFTPSNNNATGFSALPAGRFYSYNGNNYSGSGDNTTFWTSTVSSSESAWVRTISGNSNTVTRSSASLYTKKQYDCGSGWDHPCTDYFYFHFSVRCLRD